MIIEDEYALEYSFILDDLLAEKSSEAYLTQDISDRMVGYVQDDTGRMIEIIRTTRTKTYPTRTSQDTYTCMIQPNDAGFFWYAHCPIINGQVLPSRLVINQRHPWIEYAYENIPQYIDPEFHTWDKDTQLFTWEMICG